MLYDLPRMIYVPLFLVMDKLMRLSILLKRIKTELDNSSLILDWDDNPRLVLFHLFAPRMKKHPVQNNRLIHRTTTV